jgi:hypothetical protein
LVLLRNQEQGQNKSGKKGGTKRKRSSSKLQKQTSLKDTTVLEQQAAPVRVCKSARLYENEQVSCDPIEEEVLPAAPLSLKLSTPKPKTKRKRSKKS